jgi:hypothetical protein
MYVRQYQPIYPSLVKEINNGSKTLHGLLLMGDLAYDFYSK